MRIALVLLAVTLAGCGQRQQNGQANATALPTPGPRPSGSPGSVAGSSFDQGFRQSYRSAGISTCVSGARARAPQVPQSNFETYCTCFIDRSMAGLSVDQLTSLQPGPREQAIAEQCARESGLAPGGSGGK
jgi:hypothetical protein